MRDCVTFLFFSHFSARSVFQINIMGTFLESNMQTPPPASKSGQKNLSPMMRNVLKTLRKYWLILIILIKKIKSGYVLIFSMNKILWKHNYTWKYMFYIHEYIIYILFSLISITSSWLNCTPISFINFFWPNQIPVFFFNFFFLSEVDFRFGFLIPLPFSICLYSPHLLSPPPFFPSFPFL